MMMMMSQLGQAIRRLRRAPGYVAAFVLTLGLAIGVNSAVFSVVNGTLLQPLPVEDAERILFVKHTGFGQENIMFSFMELDDYRSAAATVDELVEFRDWEFTVIVDSEPHRTLGGMITSNYFEVLEMRPALGRIFDEPDDARDAEAVLVLTDEFWDRMFGRDPAVIGRIVDLEHLTANNPPTPARIVGVLEPGIHYSLTRRPDFYANYAANGHYSDASMRDSRGHRMTQMFVRTASGVSVDAVRSELESITKRIHSEYPSVYRPQYRHGIQVLPWKDELTHEGRATFLFLMGTVALVLLLAAANVTNLVLTRLIRKEGELATRIALGANATELRLQITAENVVLGLAGGALGVLLAFLSRDSLVAYASRFTVRAQEVGVDWTVLGVTLGGGILLAAMLAWLPGLPVRPRAGRVAFAQRGGTDTRARKRLQRGLVVGQLALSFALLTGTGLLVRSLLEITAVAPGFRTQQILTMRTPTGPRGLPRPDSDDSGWPTALEEIRTLPGVRAAAVASWAPLSNPTKVAFGVRTEEDDPAVDRSHVAAANHVTPGYLEMLDMRLVSGRYFEEIDGAESPPVIILNQSMARAYYGDADPVGRRIWIAADGLHVFRTEWHLIVGVVADTKEHGVDVEGVHTFYAPAAQTKWGPAIVVDYQGDPSVLAQHVRDVIHRMEPNRAVEDVQALTALLEQDLAPARLNAILFGSFAALALLIAALGVLGTLAFSVSQRVREFGIRMAIGADRGTVLQSVLREGALLVLVALVLGVAASLFLGRFLSGLLYEIDPVDLPSMAVAAVALGTVALGAALLPALRATRIHPTEALRGD